MPHPHVLWEKSAWKKANNPYDCPLLKRTIGSPCVCKVTNKLAEKVWTRWNHSQNRTHFEFQRWSRPISWCCTFFDQWQQRNLLYFTPTPNVASHILSCRKIFVDDALLISRPRQCISLSIVLHSSVLHSNQMCPIVHYPTTTSPKWLLYWFCDTARHHSHHTRSPQ